MSLLGIPHPTAPGSEERREFPRDSEISLELVEEEVGDTENSCVLQLLERLCQGVWVSGIVPLRAHK